MSKPVSMFLCSIACCCFVVGSAVLAQTPVPPSASEAKTLEQYLMLVRGDLEARRDSAMQTLLELSPEEAKAFAPLKSGYEQELAAISKRRMQLVEDYLQYEKKLTNDKARELGERANQVDMDRLALRKKYFDKI